MPGRIQAEILQSKPFPHVEQEAYVNIQRTADVLTQRLTDLLRPYDLTPTQYNVLRILRGAGDEGLCCKDVGSRMVTRDPDITRLLDRLAKRQLVTRDRSDADRRFLAVRITRDGLQMLAELDKPMQDFHVATLRHVGSDRLNTLIEILEQVRERIA